MNLKECKKGIRDFFPLKDWKHKAGLQGGYFIRETENIRYDFNYGITNYINEFKIGWSSGIAFKSLEKIYIKAKKIDTKSGKTTLYLMDTSPDYFNGKCSIDYRIKSEEDIVNMYKKIEDFLYNKAPDFFEKVKTMDELDKWLNTNPGSPIEYVSNSIRFNSQYGIIAAKLNNNPQYMELIDIYRKLQKGDNFAYEFDQVVEYLKGI